ncbi:G5 domain-containing protein [Candidatus Saccharibacteria bacterium]|nr:G5 domain-containing protein [Candidatus Saccharibacteria bacterium]
MKLTRRFDRALVLLTAATVLLFLGCLIRLGSVRTFAEGEEGPVLSSDTKFVTFFDDGNKLIVKTEANTVQDALNRAGLVLNVGDKVEPALDTAIDMDNFFINIYRARPVMVKDGINYKYLMTAGHDAKTIARDAGFLIYDGDEVELMPNMNFLEAGAAEVYQIVRNGGQNLTVEEEIPFGEERIKDYNLAPGSLEVRQLGEVGMRRYVYEVFYVDGAEVSRELISEEVIREPVERVVAIGASAIEKKPLTASMGRNRYTITLADGRIIERQETYYDLPMSGVMGYCGGGSYSVRADGVKVDADGYVLVAAELSRYPRCSIVETSLGLGKVYDTGTFALTNPEQFDLATDWTNRDGR